MHVLVSSQPADSRSTVPGSVEVALSRGRDPHHSLLPGLGDSSRRAMRHHAGPFQWPVTNTSKRDNIGNKIWPAHPAQGRDDGGCRLIVAPRCYAQSRGRVIDSRDRISGAISRAW